MQRCFACFREYGESYGICPFCGRERIVQPKEPVYLRPGSWVGEESRYQIGEAVGAGGFGIVYKAWDGKLNTVVAIKEFFVSRLMTRAEGERDIIVTRKSQEEFGYRRDRFLAEARNMAKFSSHPNIPHVYEYFEENNTAYIVMELLEGMTLSEFLAEKGGRLEPELAVSIACELGEAVKALHGEGIIHRDIAPDNVFLCYGEDLKVKLMDLGAARLEDVSDEVIDIILKPGYSPPEQYDNSSSIGPWTDIYALGATLYMMLTGVKPEESTNRKITDSVRYPRELNEEIPENISNTVMKAMALEKHLRFSKTDDFLKALQGKKKVDTIEQERQKRRRRRNRSILAAALVVLLTGIGLWQYFEAKREKVDLKEAVIQVWYPVEEGSQRGEAMEAVLADFKEKFPLVTVEARAIPAQTYLSELERAAAAGALPQLFYSSGAGQALLDQALSAEAVLKEDQAAECLFLDQLPTYYGHTKQIPLGFELPVAVVITDGPVSIDYSVDSFVEPADFGKGTVITLDLMKGFIETKNFRDGNSSLSDPLMDDREAFFNQKANSSPVLLTSTMVINEVRERLTDYTKKIVFYDGEKVYGRFLYEWSLGTGSREQEAAAERLLAWMLGNVYQSILMISEASDGELPLNETCLLAKLENRYLEPLRRFPELYKRAIFER